MKSATTRVVAIGLLGIVVAAAIYAVGRTHTPNYATSLFGQTLLNAVALKAALATVVLGLAAVQVLLGLWLYRKLPLAGRAPKPVARTHRIIGLTLFAVSAPIALHCLLAYGVQFYSVRVAVHSIAGCFFYGAFAAKVLLVHSRRIPGWALPVAGGTLAVIVVVLWYTSALWYYHGFSLPG